MVLSAVVIILYCTLGGFLAASTTDFIQSIIMTIALVVVVGVGEGIDDLQPFSASEFVNGIFDEEN